ncbi:MAG: T9SS type A sorting domain-containing protein [Bacteroidetes bacterium]|nr:T9SS type A sorting domain-containing protein [Bacteroidota bacterium]
MKFNKLLTIAIMVICFNSQAQDISWANKAGGVGSDQGYDVSTDNIGNVYACGWFSGTSSFGSTSLASYGLQDVFLACYTAGGTLTWVKQAGGTGNEVCAGIATTPNGDSYVTGWFTGTAKFGNSTLVSNGSYDMFVARYNAAGSLLWVRSGGGMSDDYGNRVSLTRNGGVLVSGSFKDTVSISGIQLISKGNRDVLLCQYDSTGQLTWAQRAGGAGEDRGYGVGQHTNGEIYLTGLFTGMSTFDTILLNGTALLSTYVAKLSEQGAFIWVKPGGGGANDFARGLGLKLDNDGNVIGTGFFSGTLNMNGKSLSSKGGQYDFDTYLIKINSSGNTLWLKDLGGDGIDQGTAVNVGKSGDIYVCGLFGETKTFADKIVHSKGLSDVFVAKVDTGGNVLWLAEGGGAGSDYLYGIACGKNGSVYVTGAFNGSGTFGSQTLVSDGGLDAFVLKLTDNATGIHSMDINGSINIYPNPAFSQFYVELKEDRFKTRSELILWDMLGHELKHETINKAIHEVDISGIKSGCYFVEIRQSGTSFKRKLVIE